MDNSNPAGWTPQPPLIPEDHPQQRYYRSDSSGISVTPKDGWEQGSVRVYRAGAGAHAELMLRTSGHQAEIRLDLSPVELRQLAHACLDAAHDIQAEDGKL